MSQLLDTIKADLHAGESWFVSEAESVGLFLWNTLKGAFIALGPAEAEIVRVLLSTGVASFGAGKSIEETFTAILNSAKDEEKLLLAKLGTGIATTLIAGLKANITLP